MGKLMQSLGLGDVSANVNEVPDGKYDAVVEKSELFFNEAKDQVSHVITYRIDGNDPDTKGKNKQEYFTLGTQPRTGADGSGEFAKSEDELNYYKNSQTKMNKQFHKKRFVDLGVDETRFDAGQVDFGDLVNIPCTIDVKTNEQGYQNVKGAWKRDGNAASVPATQAVSLGGAPASPAPTESVSTPTDTGVVGIAGGLA